MPEDELSPPPPADLPGGIGGRTAGPTAHADHGERREAPPPPADLPGGIGGRTAGPTAHTGHGERREGHARIQQNLPSPFTTIDLSKPGDLALVHRAVVNGWDVPHRI